MHDDTTEDEALSGGGKYPENATLIGLPDELAEWADQNRPLILRIQGALNNSYAGLTNDQLWEAIAANCSPEWQLAQAGLRAAEKEWNDLNHPANRPLGLIGQALDSEETERAGDRYALSLSHFTIIDEGLRQRPDLEKLLNVLLVQKRMLGQSEAMTLRTLLSTEQLADMTPLSDEFCRAARRRGIVVRQFKSAVRAFLVPREQKAATGVIVPWSPKI
ncbi:MAG: hypothetical protein KGL10_00280 [Alphaproteobacteria bacterium]|nr:hypothetical protein [Alphaproteobacteria bacterium]MDE2335728.1 hypothetical protein [Alphaproteobacteria bacterium]